MHSLVISCLHHFEACRQNLQPEEGHLWNHPERSWSTEVRQIRCRQGLKNIDKTHNIISGRKPTPEVKKPLLNPTWDDILNHRIPNMPNRKYHGVRSTSYVAKVSRKSQDRPVGIDLTKARVLCVQKTTVGNELSTNSQIRACLVGCMRCLKSSMSSRLVTFYWIHSRSGSNRKPNHLRSQKKNNQWKTAKM